jgi:hypothetical protein
LVVAVTENGILADLITDTEKRIERGDAVTIEVIQRVAGMRAAGPLLLFPALVAVSPLTIIPGIPTTVAISTVLVAAQIAIGRQRVWLPHWLRATKLPAPQGRKLFKFLKPISKKADAVVKPRATFLTAWPFRRAGAAVCVLIGVLMPITEVIPFTSTWAGATIGSYALAITVRDGFLAVAWMCFITAVALVAINLLS